MSRLAEIYKYEKEKGGGIGSTLKERAKEKYDPRQFLDQKGFMTALLPILKAYKSPAKRPYERKTELASISPLGTGAYKVLERIQRNTSYLPIMAKDTNIMKQNIGKLVKVFGETPREKAEKYFAREKLQENEYESKFVKEGKVTTPTKTKEGEKKSFLSSFLSSLTSLFSTKGLLIAGLVSAVVLAMREYFKSEEFRKKINQMVSDLFGTLKELAIKHWKEILIGIAILNPLKTLQLALTGINLFANIFSPKSAFMLALTGIAATFAAGKGFQYLKESQNELNELRRAERERELTPEEQARKKSLESTLPSEDNANILAAAGATGAAVIAGSAAKDAFKLMPQTKDAILDAKTNSVGAQSGGNIRSGPQKPLTKWGRFLRFLEARAPKLWARIGIRLMLAAPLLAIPVAGWIIVAAKVLGSLWLAWEVYGYWQEFTQEDIEDNSKETENERLSRIQREADTEYRAAQSATSTGTTPIPATSSAPSTTPSGPTPNYSSEGKASGGGQRETGGAGGRQGAPRGKTEGVVFHHTGGRGLDNAIATLQSRGLGYHYLIDRDGTVVPYMDPNSVAYHTGETEKNPKFGNFNTIGIAAVAKDDTDVTPEQMASAAKLTQELAGKFGFSPQNVFGHGQLTSRKMPDEGMALVNAVKGGAIPSATTTVATSTQISQPSLKQNAPLPPRKGTTPSVALKEVAETPSTTPTPIPKTGSYAEKVGEGESGGKYDTVYGKAGGAMINGKSITENTIAEVAAWQASVKSKNIHGAGKYGIMDVGGIAKAAGIDPNAKFDAENQEKMMQYITKTNASYLEKQGIKPTDANLALAHSLGAGGTAKIFKALQEGRGDEKVADVLGFKEGSAARTTNPHLEVSVKQYIAQMEKKHGSGSSTALESASSTSIPAGAPAGAQTPSTEISKTEPTETGETSASGALSSIMSIVGGLGEDVLGKNSPASRIMKKFYSDVGGEEGLSKIKSSLQEKLSEASSLISGQDPLGNILKYVTDENQQQRIGLEGQRNNTVEIPVVPAATPKPEAPTHVPMAPAGVTDPEMYQYALYYSKGLPYLGTGVPV